MIFVGTLTFVSLDVSSLCLISVLSLLMCSWCGVISAFTSIFSTLALCGILSGNGKGGDDRSGTIKSSLISRGGEKLGTMRSSAILSVRVEEYRLEALSNDEPS